MIAPLGLVTVVALVGAVRATSLEAQGNLQAIPPLTARVTDLTGTLNPDQKQTLENELAALEAAKGAQLGVLVVPSTEPEDIAAYGIRVADAWKLGRKGTDDGVILIVALQDRRVRIEVGRGLEGAIPDAAAARVIREYLSPRFREGDYYGGIHDAVGALTTLINDEPLPPPLIDDRDTGVDATKGIGTAFIAAWFVALFLRGAFGRLPGVVRAGITGAGAGAAAWLASGLVLMGAAGVILGIVLGLFGGGAGRFARRGGWGGWGDGGGFGSGGRFGGGGFGGGGRSGGGGFSGGGGGFAGGGASGKW